MSDMRLDFIGLGRRNIDFSLFAKNIFGEEACIPEQQGVLNSAGGTFGVAGTSSPSVHPAPAAHGRRKPAGFVLRGGGGRLR